mgnify:FL=1
MGENIKKAAFEWLKTLSSKSSFFSSKRLERFSFIGLTEFIILGTFLYLVYMKQLTAIDATILVIPLLTAAGFNMVKTEQAKKENKVENEG